MNLDAFFAEFPTLETPRLTLRAFQPSDDADMTALLGDPEVQRHAGWSVLLARIGMDGFLAWMRSLPVEREAALWVIVPKGSEGVVGFVVVTFLKSHPEHPELAYALTPSQWGQGYATEVSRAAIDCMFERTDVNRIEAMYSVDNPQSGRVLEKVGMQHEGVLRQYMSIGGRLRDRGIYAILRSDWESSRARSA